MQKVFFSYDKVENHIGVDFMQPEAFSSIVMNSVTPSGLPPHELRLKVGSIVMLLRNISVTDGFCNGSRLRVKGMGEHTIECVDIDSNEIVILARMPLTSSESNLPFILKRRQFPLRLAYAMTINKSQGQTLDIVGIALGTSGCFDHGQLYVALSRGTSEEYIRVLAPNGPLQGRLRRDPRHTYVKNIVFRDLLDMALVDRPARQPVEQLEPLDEADLATLRDRVAARGAQLQEIVRQRWTEAQMAQGYIDDEEGDDVLDSDDLMTTDDDYLDSQSPSWPANEENDEDEVEFGAFNVDDESDENMDEEDGDWEFRMLRANHEYQVSSLSQRLTQVTVSDEQQEDEGLNYEH